MSYLDANREAHRRVVAAGIVGIYVPGICPVKRDQYVVVGRVPDYMTGVYTEDQAIANLKHAVDILIGGWDDEHLAS